MQTGFESWRNAVVLDWALLLGGTMGSQPVGEVRIDAGDLAKVVSGIAQAISRSCARFVCPFMTFSLICRPPPIPSEALPLFGALTGITQLVLLGSLSSPSLFQGCRRHQDLVVPVPRVSRHAWGLRPVEPFGLSRSRFRAYCLPRRLTAGSIPSLPVVRQRSG
jgi:hypothetical protein